MSDATSTPDAPAAPEAAGGAAPQDIPVPEGAAPVPEAPAGDGELDINDLPAAAQDYIRELREENKARRQANEPYKKAFEHFNQAEQEYLVNMVEQLGVNQEVGAQAMMDLSQRLLGIDAAAETVAADPDVIAEGAQAGLTPEQVQQMIQEERSQAQMIANIEAETRSVGFDPESEEAAKLWDLAVALDEPDLSKVAPLVRQHLGLPEPEGEAAPAEVAAEPAPEASAAQFPVNAAATGGVGGSNAEERTAPPAIKSDEMRDRLRRRIEAEAGR